MAARRTFLLRALFPRWRSRWSRKAPRKVEQLSDAAAAKPAAAASEITVTIDSTFIRSREDGERHLEVRVGNVETPDGGRQVFGSVAKRDTDIASLIRRSLKTVGRTTETTVTAFTDGCLGLQSILAEAGITTPPIADWFHIAMRLQHAKQAPSGLSTDEPRRTRAKTAIVAEVERLHWRIWNGKAKDAQRTIERIRRVMHVFRGERGHRTKGVPSGGTRCMRLRTISVARARGSSIMPSDIVQAYGLELR
jgi:hypothetical protein